MRKIVWLVTLNWNNGKDTIECVKSILAATGQDISGIVICDNASSDGSEKMILDWARQQEYSPLEIFHNKKSQHTASIPITLGSSNQPHLVFIHTGANLGFAGGNNVGIRWITQNIDYDFIFLLNNDALITPHSVRAMTSRFKDVPNLGICGATVIYNWNRQIVQALGGASFEPWLARAKHIGAHTNVSAPRDQAAVEKRLDYILGAAMMISRQCLEKIGSLNEDYFLYYEEADWAERARRSGFLLGYAPNAEIYHKEGGTIGSNTNRTKRSLLSEYYLFNSRMRFTRRFYPWFLPTVAGISIARIIRSLRDGDFRRANTQLRGMLGLRRPS